MNIVPLHEKVHYNELFVSKRTLQIIIIQIQKPPLGYVKAVFAKQKRWLSLFSVGMNF